MNIFDLFRSRNREQDRKDQQRQQEINDRNKALDERIEALEDANNACKIVIEEAKATKKILEERIKALGGTPTPKSESPTDGHGLNELLSNLELTELDSNSTSSEISNATTEIREGTETLSQNVAKYLEEKSTNMQAHQHENDNKVKHSQQNFKMYGR